MKALLGYIVKELNYGEKDTLNNKGKREEHTYYLPLNLTKKIDKQMIDIVDRNGYYMECGEFNKWQFEEGKYYEKH